MRFYKKTIRWIALIIAILGLTLLPVFYEMHYVFFYYIWILIVFIPAILRIAREEKYEEKFYNRWHQARKRGRWFNVIVEGLKSLFYIILIINLTQLFANGLSPMEIASELSTSVFGWFLFIFLLTFSYVIGIVTWHENEKKYYEIYYRRREE